MIKSGLKGNKIFYIFLRIEKNIKNKIKWKENVVVYIFLGLVLLFLLLFFIILVVMFVYYVFMDYYFLIFDMCKFVGIDNFINLF